MTYIDWIKTQPCALCQTDQAIDPHHLIADGQGAMGSKSPDELLMPLCRHHHNRLHDDPIGFVANYGMTQEEMICRTLRRAVFEGWEMRRKT